MPDSARPPEAISGLDTGGQFHIGDNMTIAVAGGYIRLMCSRSGNSTIVTAESITKTLRERYFAENRVQA